MPFDMEKQIDEWKKSLLDTTKRNRLIKFSTGRGGGVSLLHPEPAELWQGLIDGNTFRFPWKRDILGLPANMIDSEPDADQDPPIATIRTEPNDLFGGVSTSARDTVRPGPAAKTIAQLTQECLASPRLAKSHLLTELSDRKLATRLLGLARTAKEAADDHGVSTLYAAFGFLRWFESPDSDEELRSPLILVPVSLRRASVDAIWSLSAGDADVALNHCLAQRLAGDFKLRLPVGPDAESELNEPEGLDRYLKQVAQILGESRRWTVEPGVAVGIFNFQKLAMWEDLNKNAGRIAEHAMSRAIAGDGSVEVRVPPAPVESAGLDERIPPNAVSQILDADSSQQEAIEAVKSGADVVVDGPPGTGKSQTIANCIAELLAAGKTVLFVSEKSAALDVVKRRLDDRGLGDFCLELHSHKANKREVAAELGRCLGLGPERVANGDADLAELADVRTQLNAYVAELHRDRTPLGMSAFRVHGELARLSHCSGRTRWTDPRILARDSHFLRAATDCLTALSQLRGVVADPTRHPWRGCRLSAVTRTNLDDLRDQLEQLSTAARRLSEGTTLADLSLEGPVVTKADWARAMSVARRVLDVPLIPAGWFAEDPRASVSAAMELHEITAGVRRSAAGLDCFTAEALDPRSRDAALRIASQLESARRGPVVRPGASAREQQAAVAEFRAALTAMVPRLRKCASAFPPLAQALRATGLARPGCVLPSVNQIRNYARVAAEVARSHPVLPGWWDAARREAIRSAARRVAELHSAAQAQRTALTETFLPDAFAPEARGPVREALHAGRSFWSRLLPIWGRIRSRIGSWYVGPVPPTAKLLADLGRLDAYHRTAISVQNIETEFAADTLAGADGRIDWAQTVEALNEVESLGRRNLPAELKVAMGPGGGLDRDGLDALAADVLRTANEIRDAWPGLPAGYLPDGPDRPIEALIRQLEMDEAAAGATAEAVDALVRLIKPEVDVRLDDCVDKLRELSGVLELRSRLPNLTARLHIRESPDEVVARDWSELAAAAAALGSFLRDVTEAPQRPTIEALTDEAARHRVRAAVGACEAVEPALAESWTDLVDRVFPANEPVSHGIILDQATIGEIASWAADRAGDLHRLEEWTRYRSIRDEAASLGITTTVDEVCEGKLDADIAADAFRRRFLSLWLDEVYAGVPALKSFSTAAHESRIRRFADLDRQSLRMTPARLRAALLGRPDRPRADGSAPPTSELGIVLREANKKRGHLPVRRLLAAAPGLLARIKPCLMMSPLAVSTYLDSPQLTFDVVIFDEASQVRPHDAVCAVYRGRQLVVAGDPKQLPPTNFFARTEADDDDVPEDATDGTDGFESLLDVCLSLGMTRKQLRWHYRSRREGLIAFSNRHFYKNQLITFPSVDEHGEPAVRLERVRGRFEDGVNVPEARHVADLIMRHARTARDRSLGVIAFSQRQQNRILDELETLRRSNLEFEDFFRDDRNERFFVKNLENVQGDERDAIILAVGYGPDAQGKVAMRFGPLNQQGGERRLNVAVTRARWSMLIVSSMTAADIDLARTRAEGPRLMRAFLDYAERGPAALSDSINSAAMDQFDSPFEQEVCEELRRRGLEVRTQIGSGGYRVDLAIVDPDQPGRFLLGVECDGATYHASATARDRDRLRQEVLENLGWRLCRVWSTDWLRDRKAQVDRVLAALESARRVPGPPRRTPPPCPSEPPPPAPPDDVPPPAPAYDNIDQVPELVVRTTVLSVLSLCGATEPDDLCLAVAKKLGFSRAGAKIRARVEHAIESLAREKKIHRHDDGRWTASPAPPRDQRGAASPGHGSDP